MLKYSAFAPLGRSMSYMLREEAFHMGTGNDGLRRIVEAGVIPGWLIQKYLNKWISSSYDLFGTDHSSSAHWAYVWGVKGRYDEPKNEHAPDLDDLNDYNRNLYRDEVAGLIERFNGALKAGQPRLYAPHIKFNREIGRWAGQKFHAQKGEPLDDRAYAEHLKDYMPSAEDKKLLLPKRSGSPKKSAPETLWPASVKFGSRRSTCNVKVYSQPRHRDNHGLHDSGIQTRSAHD
jgi:benzoyl-CoA 2,3-dioxygenase component B